MPHRNSPLFSIIVPAYNVEAYLPQCIESVLAQTALRSETPATSCPNSLLELILIDDGSTDRTGEICDQYAQKLPQPSIVSQNDKKVNRKTTSPLVKQATSSLIKVIHQPNAGLSAARNAGVAVASGEYLLFLDGDDYLEPGALEAIKHNLEPGLDLLRYQAQAVLTAAGNHQPPADTTGSKIIPYPETGFATTTGVQAFPRLASYHYTENAWLYAYRRKFFVQNKFQYAEGRLAEDFGLTPLIIAKASSVKAIPDICYDYRQRAGSIMHDPDKVARRATDMLKQLQDVLPQIASIPHTEPILHYLVVSFLTGATELGRSEFLRIYQESRQAGLLRYIHPTHLKSVPRALILRHLPGLFYQIYRH